MTEPTRPILRLHNTLTRRKDPFAPIDAANVRVYACGPTVYDFAHIGNARPVIVFDVLFRLLRHLYGAERVRYVRNVTDVDDKINRRAREDFPGLPLNEAIARVTETTARRFAEDVAALGCLPPTVEPRATEHIAEMRTMIDRLVASGHAYAEAGHVLFSVPSMADYGRLSRRPLDEMEAGARVDVAPYKRSDLDFVLWKPSAEGEPGWPSPAGLPGLGRPGWHIECSAMSWAHLGETFDIHAGGLDLIFPHHENEIAQSRCCFGTPVMANVWLHNGFLQVEGEKMSKSLGNFVTIRDLLDTDRFGGRSWDGGTLRLAMMMTEYRKPIDWTAERLREASAALSSMISAARERSRDDADPPPDFIDAVADDLNTPAAITILHRLSKTVRRPPSASDKIAAADSLHAALRLLGLAGGGPIRHALEPAASSVEKQRIEVAIAERNAARGAKNWAESDRLRDELKAMGVQVMDNKDGTSTWEPLR